MIDRLLSYIAPHLCCGCSKIGTLLCDSCKYNIISESFWCCVMCGRLANKKSVCFSCRLSCERGYDHTLLIARYLAKIRGLGVDQSLKRATTSRQRGVARMQRIAQARVAFKIDKKVSGDIPYLLIDDIITTGATMQYAAKTMRQAGARQIWVAVLARQPLD